MTSYFPTENTTKPRAKSANWQLSCHILGSEQLRNGTKILEDNLGVRREVSYKNR